jgi:ABC-type nickel/cobalt efflux system permease component RcnA
MATLPVPHLSDRETWPWLRLLAFLLVGLLAIFAVWRVEQEAHRRTEAIAAESRARDEALRTETAERIYEDCLARQVPRVVLRDVIAYLVAHAQPGDAMAENLRQYVEGGNSPLHPLVCEKGTI